MTEAAALHYRHARDISASVSANSSVRKLLTWARDLLLVALAACGMDDEPFSPRRVLDLSGDGWRLWLDRAAAWEHDELLPPPVDLATVPVHEPTGGWSALEAPAGDAWFVDVPSTVETWAWDALAQERRAAGEAAPDDPLAGDHVGVSWWTRAFDVPADWLAPRVDGPARLRLQFDAVRLRAEVFVNRRLVAYDAVGNTPFEADVTGSLQAGRNELAVRVTDPGGNFDWRDHEAHAWGDQRIPASHGFGGVTGPVRLSATGPVRFRDAWVVNGMDPRLVGLHVELENTGDAPATVAWLARIARADGSVLGAVVVHVAVACPPGVTYDSVQLSVPGAALWSPESPALHLATFELTTGRDVSTGMGVRLGRVDDAFERRFGFRSFAVDDADGHAVLRLNGERIVLRSDISWGFWPVTGSVPWPDLALRQVGKARWLGLNMLNHHRTLAAPGLLDVHDEYGLLAYEEPGGYAVEGGGELARALAREKLARMVRRDRSHPSLVIVNLINEEQQPPTDAQREDLLAVHAADPDVVVTFTSAWAKAGDDPLKLHVRPHEDVPRTHGWWDYHNASGPGVWRDGFYKAPDDWRRRTENEGEVVLWGEEGAIACPPALEIIGLEITERAFSGLPLGWDGVTHLAWRDAYAHFLDRKGLDRWFPFVDELALTWGGVMHDYQARAIEQVRMGNVADGYVINGWESQLVENHSGIVDLWRNVKHDPARLKAANADTLLVVRLRSSVAHAGEWLTQSTRLPVNVLADVWLVDETGLSGRFVLRAALRDETGEVLWSNDYPVELPADGAFGRLLLEQLLASGDCDEGQATLTAELRPAAGGAPVAVGSDTLWVVDWRGQALPTSMAVLEQSRALRGFFARNERPEPQVFHVELPPVDVLLVGDWEPELREVVPAEALGHVELTGPDEYRDSPGWFGNLEATIRFDDAGVAKEYGLQHPTIDFEWSRDPPTPWLPRTNYEVEWNGWLRPSESGHFALQTLSDDGVQLWLGDGVLEDDVWPDGFLGSPGRDAASRAPLIDNWDEHEPTWDRAEVELRAGVAYPLRLRYSQRDGGAQIRLCWTRPSQQSKSALLVAELLRRAREDGTTLCFLANTDRWAAALAQAGAITYGGPLVHGKYWLGGGFAARPHQLFNGLPTGALGREWQELIQYGATRLGLRLEGEECLAFCWSDHQPEPATAVGVVPCGKGRILLSTLDVARSLNGPAGPADVTRRYFVNVLQWAGAR